MAEKVPGGDRPWLHHTTEDTTVNLVRDILRADPDTGTRRPPDPQEARRFIAGLLGETSDYTTRPFHEAVSTLASLRGWSVRGFAGRLACSPTWAHQILEGTAPASPEWIVRVAEAFGKSPAYFREYRIMVVASAVAQYFEEDPERNAVYTAPRPASTQRQPDGPEDRP